MVRIFLTLTLIATVWFGGALSDNHRVVASQSDSSTIFDGYSNSEFQGLMRRHRNLKDFQYENQPMILYANWFSDNRPAVCWFLGASSVGKTFSFRHVLHLASQASHHEQLSSEQLVRLHQLFQSLPKSSTKPEIKDLLVFSYFRNGEWITELFNRHELNADLIEIFKMFPDPHSPVLSSPESEETTGTKENNH